MTKQRAQSICKDEMNLAEFPLSVIGKRPPKGVKTLEFSDEITNPQTGDKIIRHVTVTGSDLLGLPTSVDDEVIVGCLKLTKDDGMKRRRVPFTAYQFLEEIGWPRDGKGYRRLAESLDRWKGTMVISNNAFWNKGKQKLVKDTFGLIDRWKLVDEEAQASGKSGWFVWGDFMWESLQSGNIRTLDFDFWKNLESPVAKRLFRLLDKKFYKRRQVTFSLSTLAFDKVGVSRKMHTGQVKETLRKGHTELERKGFCKSEFIKKARGAWEVVYTDLRQAPKELPQEKVADPLVAALVKRGIKNSSELLRKQPSRKRIEQAIENYDDRLIHGEALTHRWLASNILHSVGYDFRAGYQSKAETVAAKKAKCEREKRQQLAQHDAEQNRQRQEQAIREACEQYLATLDSDQARKKVFAAAFKAYPLYEKLFTEAIERSDLKVAERHRRDALLLYWKKMNSTDKNIRAEPSSV